MSMPTPFTISIPQSKLDTIARKVRDFEWIDVPEGKDAGDGWSYGADQDYLKEFCTYWLDGYDWRRWEAQLNTLPQFIATVNDIDIHYVHIKGSNPDNPPLLITHGWPGSYFEFFDVLDRIANPAEYGGDEADGRDVIAPSIPGYAFSGRPQKPMGPRAVAALWNAFMRDALGIESYIAQGGDWGAIISGWIAFDHSKDKQGGCLAVHLNFLGVRGHMEPKTEEDQAWMQHSAGMQLFETAYLQIQGTKPLSLTMGMSDSPVGQAAWILEKFYTWGDVKNGDIESAFTKDHLLTNLMLYVATDTFNTATWMYRGVFEEGGVNLPPGETIDIPTGIANFPGDTVYSWPPRSMVEAGYSNIVQWTDHEKGGHFAALEQPDAFVADVMAFLKQAPTQ
ncbi:epoxide hydrolase family protein [Pyruvatibacter sp.]|uniref:epoxide hydrolase family protein n=1 Tax=Pyruvatibacter sp. TaxID=1981328 RepID=UPI003265BA6F